MMLACGTAKPEDCALSVYATVVSRAAPERGILDAGSKTLTADSGGLNDGFGLILEYPQAGIAAFAEEHGFLDLSRSNARRDSSQAGSQARTVQSSRGCSSRADSL
jgi:D-serine deaminase-like pyridoxal phosphate-dependent protein